jgi:dTDP-4-amino-4,6-dideoxygalactose transaminase
MHSKIESENLFPQIPFALPWIGREEEEAVLRVLRSGWLTTGKEALAFEKEFAEFLQSPPEHSAGEYGREASPHDSPSDPLHCLAVNSATSGLHLALEACGIRAGDLVLVPSYTFTATAEIARYLGAIPVFVDVKPGTFHLDPEKLEETLARLEKGLPAYSRGFGPRGMAKAVIPVHYGGLPCDMEAVMDLAARYGIKVIEDAAHSFPSRLDSGMFAGSIGDAGVFSFYATKPIATGEGGMVVTRNRDTAARISLMRSHGIDRSVWNRYTETQASWYYEVVEAGYKYNFPDLLAAVGRVQLSRAWDLFRMRQSIAERYDRAFGTEEALFKLPPGGPGDARHLYPLRINGSRLKINRDEFIKKLQKQGIGVSVHYIPLHIMPYYRDLYGLKPEDFPHSLNAFREVISLPIWPGMTEEQIDRVIEVVTGTGRENS